MQLAQFVGSEKRVRVGRHPHLHNESSVRTSFYQNRFLGAICRPARMPEGLWTRTSIDCFLGGISRH